MIKEKTLRWDELQTGQELPAISKKPTYAHLFMFSAATWNRHMIHYNAEYARSDGLPDVAVHRALIGNYLAQLLGNWVGTSGLIRKLDWNVRASAFPGETLICKGKIKEKREDNGARILGCDIWVEKEDGQLVAPGYGEVRVDE